MPERRTTVEYPRGKQASGVSVDVEESTERFSDIRLSDGTRIRIKPVITEAVRVDDQWDVEGNPIYVVKSANVMTVSEVSDDLKKKRVQ